MNRRARARCAAAVWVVAVAICAGSAWAGTDAPLADEVSPPAFTSRGADTCLKCHDEDKKVPVMSIFRTAHARPADARTPFAGHQCEACHGPGDAHAKGGNEEVVPYIRNFGVKEPTPVAEQNGVCLDCHGGGHRTQWAGSAHDTADLSCASCHRVHAPRDPVLQASSQAETCYSCHQQQRAELLKPFAHPVRQGALACTDCHAVHGGPGDALLASPTLNQTCYSCHADKRGPFLWEHAPVAEDCSVCHQPHGASQPALLTQRTPWLCQSCHAPEGHPSLAFTARGLPGNAPSGFLLGQGCVNCHSQVHGSNHPSGATLTR